MTLTNLRTGFRDDAQRQRVQRVVHDRLADDREQQECRYLMRFWWQLLMGYQEVTIEQLRLNVGPSKLDIVEQLIGALRSSPEAVDAWVVATERAFPVIEDRGFAAGAS
ncbi:hypothetical protein OG455_05525 [Kitasatospora sp. NBC_01287]|uniref:hypothetical protein n=1 Tax=Kitasatospora sp. NBC_01287 TaxID=2903573 RepID=UPI00225132CA|nr:hypothetical protein [Kitasatospora sp. NBC_01287]MCX4744988.1 hypothetical protein [Kitasatospora sp. NBC_01287]